MDLAEIHTLTLMDTYIHACTHVCMQCVCWWTCDCAYRCRCVCVGQGQSLYTSFFFFLRWAFSLVWNWNLPSSLGWIRQSLSPIGLVWNLPSRLD